VGFLDVLCTLDATNEIASGGFCCARVVCLFVELELELLRESWRNFLRVSDLLACSGT
jgi:hypothetical protein